jgi:hypothetical protein
MDIRPSQFNLEWLPPAADANEPDLLAFQSARGDAQTLIAEMLARGYDKASVLRGVAAAVARFSKQS